jgi:fimbrial chaperone protein
LHRKDYGGNDRRCRPSYHPDNQSMKNIGILIRSCWFAALASLSLSMSATAGNFGVSPLDVQLGPQRKSSVLTVTNDDNKPLQLRVRAMRWKQEVNGADVYEDTQDLVFFPKRLDLKPGDQKVIRIGISDVSADAERGYRLFVEEIPPAETPRSEGSKLAVLLTIAVPVFVTSPDAKAQLQVLAATLRKDGALQLTVENKGRSRARFSSVQTTDGNAVTEAVSSRYLFPGMQKTWNLTVDPSLCKTSGKLRLIMDTVTVDTDLPQPRCAA